MVEARQHRRRERLDDLLLAQPAEEAEGAAADVLVGVLEVVAQVLADEDLVLGLLLFLVFCLG